MSEATTPVPLRRLWTAVLFGYLALGATIQEMPAFTVQRFHGGAVLAGAAVGIAFLATAASRPFAGLLADHGRARRVVMIGGLLGAIGGAGHLWAPDVPVLLASRLVMGAGEAALFSGALPWVLAGVEAGRRGRVAGWFGLSMWGGLSAGPVLATGVDAAASYEGVWWAVTALGVASATLVLLTPAQPEPPPVPLPRTARDVIPRGSVLPGAAFGLSAYGYGTVSGLLVLYLRQGGIGGDAVALPLFALGFLLTRALGSPLVDRHGGARVAAGSLLVEALGLLLVGTAPAQTVALTGALLAGVGVSLMYPATVSVTLGRTGALRPGTSVGTMTSFWDLGIMVAGPTGGVIAVTAGYPTAFAVATAAALASLILFTGPLRRQLAADRTAQPATARGGQ